MDSYEILGVTRDSSDKEIEISYEDLKKKYDPSFNTSIRAYTKYREVLKAYESIKNESRRKMYELKDTGEIKVIEKKSYKLFDYSREEKKKEEIKIDYNNLEEVKELVRENILIEEKVSYLYYLLNLRIDLSYFRNVNCDECKDFVKCEECDGKGVVYYREKQVYCPVCHGRGEVSKHCNKCNEEGVYKKEEKISFYVDGDTMEFKDYGNEYYDLSNSNLVVSFDFYDKDKVVIKDEEIHVSYYLSKEETVNGFSKEFYNETGAFKLDVPSFVSDGYKQEIIFNNKKIIFTFYNEAIKGSNKEYCLFINKKYKGQEIYFNSDYSRCSDISDEEYFNVVSLINRQIVLKGLGNEGKYNGENGDLIIRCIFNKKQEIRYLDNVVIISTSRVFNVLGGSIKGVKHYGFRGENCLVNYKNRLYLLSGESDIKFKLKDYFMFKVISLLVWVVIPLMMLFIPYSQVMYSILFIVFGAYLCLVNVLMEVRA